MNKKIIISVTNDLVSDQRVNKVALSLVSFGYEVLLIGRKLNNSLPLEQRNYKTKRFNLIFDNGFLFYANYNLRLFFFLLFSKSDIFLSNDLDTLPANYFASRFKNTHLVYDSHELFTEVPELVNRKRVQRFWLKIERYILPKLKNTYTVCESIASYYNERYKTDFKVVRNISLCKNKKDDYIKLENKEKIIIYQGAINIGRGLEEIIKAMPFIENARLQIIGGGDILGELRKIVSDMKLENNIEFVGKIPFQELAEYTQKADLGISLEQNIGLNYYYSLPNKLFDYFNANIPVMVSDLPETRKIIEQYNVGEIIKDFTPKALANKINSLLSNTEVYNKYKANTKIAAKELCWQNEEQVLLEVFSKLRPL